MSAALLSVDVKAGYGKQTILDGVRFQLHAGERLGLLGSSGAGKSTLLFALLGLLHHRGGWAKGEVAIGGRNLLTASKRDARRMRGKDFALVPQSPLSALNPAISLLAHFEAAWTAHRDADRRLLHTRMFSLAERVGLPTEISFFERKPGQISVGQAQRCALALALLHRPGLIIADEPTSALDPVTQTEVLALLREVSQGDQAGLLFVSHDLLSVFRLCTGVAVLSEGRIKERIAIAEVPHTRNPELRALMQALPMPAEALLRYSRGTRSPGKAAAEEGTVLVLS